MTPPTPIGVRMTRANLNDIPPANLPKDFSFRLYQPGDEQTWLDIWRATQTIAELKINAFEQSYFGDTQALTERMYFIDDAKQNSIATSTAWYGENDQTHLELGRVHWVAIIPSMQGNGLARPLLSKTLYRLHELGHEKTILGTDTNRIPAVALYLKFGFRPEIRSDEDRQAWAMIQQRLDTDIAKIVGDCLA